MYSLAASRSQCLEVHQLAGNGISRSKNKVRSNPGPVTPGAHFIILGVITDVSSMLASLRDIEI